MGFSLHILAVGAGRARAETALSAQFLARCRWPVTLVEIPPAKPVHAKSIHAKPAHIQARQAQEGAALRKACPPAAYTLVLDKDGDNVDSEALAHIIRRHGMEDAQPVAFFIGGADGLDAHLMAQAHRRLAFGRCTWPHLLVRAMLAEQVYRAQMILHAHPYHRS